MRNVGFWTIGVLPMVLAGCGVPRLYAPPIPANGVAQNGEILLAPKVANVVDEIACELGRARVQGVGLRDPYIVTVLLTLQVEDNLDLTPSLGFITGKVTTTLSGDLGGDRKRTFTTTYYLDSTKLDESRCTVGQGEKKLFTLKGDLGLADIVRDGDGTIAHQTAILHTPENKDDKSVPTYGSTVQFIVTKSVTGLGPVWTLTHFKGPGGNNQLMNGKSVRTDSVVLTFARQYTFATTAQASAVADKAVKKDKKDAAAKKVEIAQHASETVARTLAPQREALTRAAKMRNSPHDLMAITNRLQALDKQQRAADAKVTEAQADNVAAQRALDAANDQVDAADRAARSEGAASATAAGQSLLNTMVLQNLNIQPH